MSGVYQVVGLIASVFAILGGMVLCVRWLGRKFDTWTETMIENSRAVRGLTIRVTSLERTMKQ